MSCSVNKVIKKKILYESTCKLMPTNMKKMKLQIWMHTKEIFVSNARKESECTIVGNENVDIE